MSPALVKILMQLARSRSGRRLVGLGITVSVLAVVLLLAVPLMFLIVVLSAIDSGVVANATAVPSSCNQNASVKPGQTVGELAEEQMNNAAVIISVALEHNISEYGQVIALATALQESGLRNLPGGHADSIGLFQQRPSAGWGSFEQIHTPRLASAAFFGIAHHTRNTGLLDIKGWKRMPVTEAAQAVQRSAFPTAYTDDEPLARQVVAQIAGSDPSAVLCGDPGAMSCPPTGLTAETGLTPDALRVIRCLRQHFPTITSYAGVGERPTTPDSDHPSGRAVDAMIPGWNTHSGNRLGWRVARWVQTHAPQLGVAYVVFDRRIWSNERATEGWRAYAHPSGASDPTSLHRDHVHVSVYGNAAGNSDTGTGGVVLPVDKGSYIITATFGQCGSRWESCHTGLDFAAPTGSPIRAVTAGRITSTVWNSAYGNLTVIRGEDGTEFYYAHQSTQAVRTGQRVRTGQQIGTVGDTGNTTGPHLHLEVRVDGIPVDPATWLRDHGATP